MRLPAKRVLVGVVALNGPVRIQLAGFKQGVAVAIAHGHVQPDAARRIRRRKFVASQVLHRNLGFHPAIANFHVRDGDLGGVGRQVGLCAINSRVHLIG